MGGARSCWTFDSDGGMAFGLVLGEPILESNQNRTELLQSIFKAIDIYALPATGDRFLLFPKNSKHHSSQLAPESLSRTPNHTISLTHCHSLQLVAPVNIAIYNTFLRQLFDHEAEARAHGSTQCSMFDFNVSGKRVWVQFLGPIVKTSG